MVLLDAAVTSIESSYAMPVLTLIAPPTAFGPHSVLCEPLYRSTELAYVTESTPASNSPFVVE